MEDIMNRTLNERFDAQDLKLVNTIEAQNEKMSRIEEDMSSFDERLKTFERERQNGIALF